MMQQKNISLSILINIITSVLLLIPLTTLAKDDNKNKAETDTTALFRGVQIMLDVAGITQRLVSDYGQGEAALRFNLKDKYFPIIELGYGDAKHRNTATNIRYTAAAPYVRIGLDYNILKNKHDVYRLLAGVRYAYTHFKYNIQTPIITDPVWKNQTEINLSKQKTDYHWAEIVIGADAPLWKKIRMGWTLRYKKRIARRLNTSGNAWYVPGYAIDNENGLGATLYFSIAFE